MNANARTPEARIIDGIRAESTVRVAQALTHTPENLRAAALLSATLTVPDYGTCTGEDLIDLARSTQPVTTGEANALLALLGDLRELAWACEDGTITLDRI